MRKIESYQKLTRANQLGNVLQSAFGIEKGDKVSFSMRNYPEWMFCYMAITSIGAIVVPLNSWWQGDELEYGITNSGQNYSLVMKSVWIVLAIAVLM